MRRSSVLWGRGQLLPRVLELGHGVARDSSSSWSSLSSSSPVCEILGGGVMENGAKIKQQEPGKSELWLPKKGRFCASHVLPGLQYVPCNSFCCEVGFRN